MLILGGTPYIRRDFYVKWLGDRHQATKHYLEVSTGKTENDDLYLTRERHETVLTLGSCVCTSLALAAAAEECEVFRK